MHRIVFACFLLFTANTFAFCTKLTLLNLGKLNRGIAELKNSNYFLNYGLIENHPDESIACANLKPRMAISSDSTLQNNECWRSGVGAPNLTLCSDTPLLHESELTQFRIHEKLRLKTRATCNVSLSKDLAAAFVKVNAGSVRYWRVFDEQKKPLIIKTALLDYQYDESSDKTMGASWSPTPLQIGIGIEVHSYCGARPDTVDMTSVPAFQLKKIPYFTEKKGTLKKTVPGYRLIQTDVFSGTTYIIRTTLDKKEQK